MRSVRALPRAGSAAHATRKGAAPRVGLMRAETRVRPRLRQRPRGNRTRCRLCRRSGRDRFETGGGRAFRVFRGNAPFSSPRRRSRGALRPARRRTLLARYATRRDGARTRAPAPASSPPRVSPSSPHPRVFDSAASSSRGASTSPRSFATREAALTTPLSPEDRRDRRATPLLSYRIFSHNASTHVTWSSATPGTRA